MPELLALPERCGSAKRRWRAFSELDGALFELVGVAAFAATLAELSPAVAGVRGAESLLGVSSLKSLEERLCWRGTGWVCSTEPRCA